jgi:hypothetical protein
MQEDEGGLHTDVRHPPSGAPPTPSVTWTVKEPNGPVEAGHSPHPAYAGRPVSPSTAHSPVKTWTVAGALAASND